MAACTCAGAKWQSESTPTARRTQRGAMSLGHDSRAEEHAPKPSPNLPQLEPGLPDPTCVQIYALDL